MTTFPSVYSGLSPSAVWLHFGALNSIPRPSGQEEAARAYVQKAAEEQHAMWKTDARGNICVRVPAKNGNADAPIVVLQSHLDMVCQKRPDVTQNFDTDPIVPQRRDDKIYASGTTLGADNGMGVAMMLAILTSDGLSHGPLELLFTVEEETGLYGAANLDPELVRGRMLINLDSEDPDEITIGCAGGATTSLYVPVEREVVTDDRLLPQEVKVGGLQGGHSGVQIHEPLANAIKLLSALLNAARTPGTRLISVDGGTAHNAIPRDATAVVALPARELTAFESGLEGALQGIEAYWRPDEPGLTVHHGRVESWLSPLTRDSTAKIFDLMHELPHGVQKMSARFAGKVQTSCNLAEVSTIATEFEFGISNRSFLATDIRELQAKEAELGTTAGARIITRDGYPGWEPRAESPLRDVVTKAFTTATFKTPRVEVVHAGLECGLLSEKLPGLDAVSFGPLIRGAHTPEEWVSIASVDEIWRVLIQVLKDLA